MRITIKNKLITTLCVPLLLIGIFFTVALIDIQSEVLDVESNNVGEKFSTQIEATLQGQVDTVTRSVNSFYEDSRLANIKGGLADEASNFNQTIENIYKNSDSDIVATTSIYAFINEYNWGKGRYLFAFDANSLIVTAHGANRDLIGKNNYDSVDTNGKYYARDIVSEAKNNKVGFTEYQFFNPVTKNNEVKLAASFYFKPLNLVVATGEYLSTLSKDNMDRALLAISSVKYGKNGYFWVQDKDGLILAHPKAELVGTKNDSFSTIVATSIRNKSDTIVETYFENPATRKTEKKINYARKIFPEWGWVVASGAYMSDITAVQEGLTSATRNIFEEKTSLMISVSLLLIVFFSIISIFIVSTIVKGLVILKERIDALSSGEADLTSRVDIASNDELGNIGESVNKFIIYLQSMLLDISQASTHITDSIEQLSEQSERNNLTLITHASETEQIVSAITEMSATAETVAQGAAKTSTNTQMAHDEALLSKDTVLNASNSVSALVHEVASVSESIATMNDNTQQIVNVLSVIGGIADQTNLLALNAAIEAARAGEQGRGFAVVADEVRSLAARTQNSTTEINEILTKLQQDTAKAVDEMEVTKLSCERTAENTNSVSLGLDKMTNVIVEINDLNMQIATAAEEQSVVSDEVSRNMSTIHQMVQELTENGQSTVDSTRNLATTNAQLNALVGKFKLV
jgi:methyl-accepting chemotaxis protein